MKNPAPATILALRLAASQHGNASLHAWDSTRVVTIAGQVRRLVEAGCNAELTDRQAKRLDSLRKRACEVLLPYGMKLDNPWGLCHYACPIWHDGKSYLRESDCVFLA